MPDPPIGGVHAAELVIVHLGAFEICRPGSWNRALVSGLPLARCTRARQRPGSVLYVGSMTSARAGLRDTVAYGTAKSGLLGLMRTLAVEWG